MKLQADFSEAGAFSKTTVGKYLLRVVGCEAKVSKASGNNYLEFKLEIFGHPEFSGRSIFYNSPLAGKGAFRLQNLLRACGLDPNNSDVETDDLLGKELGAMLDYEKDQEGNLRKYPSAFEVFPPSEIL